MACIICAAAGVHCPHDIDVEIPPVPENEIERLKARIEELEDMLRHATGND